MARDLRDEGIIFYGTGALVANTLEQLAPNAYVRSFEGLASRASAIALWVHLAFSGASSFVIRVVGRYGGPQEPFPTDLEFGDVPLLSSAHNDAASGTWILEHQYTKTAGVVDDVIEVAGMPMPGVLFVDVKAMTSGALDAGDEVKVALKAA